jgi:glycosyltransferase involved in cell wall biosynthesis
MALERIALVVSDFEGGGVERTFANLAAGLARLGVATDLIVGRADHPFLAGLDQGVRVLPLLGEREAYLRDYLHEQRPDVLITGKLADDFAALGAREGLGVDTRIVAAVGTVLSARFAAHRFNPIRTYLETRRIRGQYGRLDGITAVSAAVAEDLRRVFRVGSVPLAVLPNPVIPENIADLAAAPCPHPWLAPNQPPVILAIGGLRKVKDYATLVRAFARLSKRLDCRLLILGEGKERRHLSALAGGLGIADRCDLPGFVDDPFPYLSRTAVLALTSRREGLGNVLVEAMALGTPVVATDCQGGVRELLQGGRIGGLVPVGNVAALADTLGRTLAGVVSAQVGRDGLRQAAEPYRLIPAARRHLEFLGSLPVPRHHTTAT